MSVDQIRIMQSWYARLFSLYTFINNLLHKMEYVYYTHTRKDFSL